MDIGAYGSEGDASVFRQSCLGHDVINDDLDFPEDVEIEGTRLPYFLVGDDAFPLSKRLMKPFSGKHLSKEQRIFNYRLSRARRCIENAFGILTAKWPVLQRTLLCSPDRAHKIITACCLFHNFLLNKNDNSYMPQKLVVKNTRNDLQNERSHGRNNAYAKLIRNKLKDYVNSPTGAVPWQNDAAFLS